MNRQEGIDKLVTYNKTHGERSKEEKDYFGNINSRARNYVNNINLIKILDVMVNWKLSAN